ncbi:hypothetical protein GTA08_BOTSDO08738 [Neofusicoccum parvum]|uniref:Uncharacterized protein n=1 Tax=Neofusicoccum parvum TaxID=310453 RepID=A0ACB5SBT3_9PEZI|nr:hypothetical protein GTA08_BOTSDO08738 [Neofusicoccum parvum]
MDSLIHVVSKSDNSQHATFPLTTPPPPLAPSSIRLRTTLITLSSNNLTYARLGDALRWWDAYPVPASAPTPYTTWGIVPAWGFATVLSSTIPALPADTTLWGFWPTASHAFDLQLRGAAPAGHWIETSPHRRALMHLYNRYVAAPIPAALPAAAATVALKPVWECGYLAARHVFAARARTPVHPLGAGLPWTPDDADLGAAVVVSLSASSKTGRGFAWNLLRNRDEGPLALLQATSAPGVLKSYGEGAVKVPSKAVGYGELATPGTVAWVAGFKPEKVVVLDFGAAGDVLEGFLEAVGAAGEVSDFKPEVVVIAVGSQMKVYSEEEMKGAQEKMAKLKKVQLNTSGIRDVAIESESPEEYFKNMNASWEKCLEESGMGEFETVPEKGIEGVEGVWQDLCEQKVKPNQAIVVRV